MMYVNYDYIWCYMCLCTQKEHKKFSSLYAQ